MTPSISKILVTLTAVFLLAACNPQAAKPTDPMTSETVVSLLDEMFMEELKKSQLLSWLPGFSYELLIIGVNRLAGESLNFCQTQFCPTKTL